MRSKVKLLIGAATTATLFAVGGGVALAQNDDPGGGQPTPGTTQMQEQMGMDEAQCDTMHAQMSAQMGSMHGNMDDGAMSGHGNGMGNGMGNGTGMGSMMGPAS